MTTNVAVAKAVDIGLYSSAVADAPGLIRQRNSRVYEFRYAGDSAANVNVSESGLGINFRYPGHLAELYIKPEANAALNTTNYGYINIGLVPNGSLARVNASMGVVNTAVAALTAFTRTNVTITSNTLLEVNQDDQLVWVTSKPGGTGVTIPAFTLVAVVEDT